MIKHTFTADLFCLHAEIELELRRRGWSITSQLGGYQAVGVDAFGNVPGTSTTTASEGAEDAADETSSDYRVAVEAGCAS